MAYTFEAFCSDLHNIVKAKGQAGLPEGAVGLVDEASRAAGWALFATPGLALAVFGPPLGRPIRCGHPMAEEFVR